GERGGARVMSIVGMLVAALLVLGACSGDDGNDNRDGAAAEPDLTTTTTEAAAPEPEIPETTEPEPMAPASAGCDTEAVEPVVEAERTLTVGDVARRYLLTVPSAHDGETPLPVVFDFHGLMEGADIHAGMTA